MTLRVNSSFATTLAASTASNQAWSDAFKTGLGATRRLICKIAPLGTAQEDVYTIGTKFRDAAITGEMVVEGGVVTNYGVTSNLTTSVAADLANGIAVLRIEGNGNWVEGTLGLVGSNADFVLPANPTATNSIAVLPNTRIKPPPFLPSGTGYAPPADDVDTPAYVRLVNYQNPATPVEADRIYFNNRIDNWVFTDPDIAVGMGDVRVTQSTDMVVYGSAKHGDFEFGATLLSMNASANSVTSKPVHQVVVMCKPTSGESGNWPRYPRLGGYKRSTRQMPRRTREYGISKTFPPAFKLEVCRANGTVLGIVEMPMDKLPINSSELQDFFTVSKPKRLKWNCAQLLMWQSHDPKLSTKAKKFLPGTEMRAIRPSMNKEKASIGGVDFTYRFSNGTIGIEHWYAVGKWPYPLNPAVLYAVPSPDPYLYSQAKNGESAPWSTPGWAATYFGIPQTEVGSAPTANSLMHGLGYEPANPGLHNHSTGPGGIRVDRAYAPSPTVIHMTDPTYVHLRSGLPIAEVAKHWNMGYFNHAYHYVMDVRTGDTLPMDELLSNKWSYSRSYYGGNDFYTSGVEYAVPQFAVPQGPTDYTDEPHNGYYTDENYYMPWNAYAIDDLHDYSTPFYAAAIYNSPAHAYALKHRYVAHLLVMGNTKPSSSMLRTFGLRSFAWMVHQEVFMWKMASEHRLGISRDIPFNRLVGLFNSINRDYYIPIYEQNSQDPHMLVMKRFGTPVGFANGRWGTRSFGLQYYLGGVFMNMRNYGLWNVLWNHSTSVRNGMLMSLRMLDTAISYINETNCSYVGDVYSGEPQMMVNATSETAPDVPVSWTDWLNRVIPADMKTAIDFVTNGDGSYRRADSSQHLKLQWAKIRKDYFSDIPCEYDVNAAVTKVDTWYSRFPDRIAAAAAAGESPAGQRGMDWTLLPSYAPVNPPVEPLTPLS